VSGGIAADDMASSPALGKTMTPAELASRHPRLYHITHPGAWPSIQAHGLMPVSSLLTLFEVPAAARMAIERARRPERVLLAHPIHGEAEITDNRPLSESALASRLDDGLTTVDWLTMLNRRVFFWAGRASYEPLLNARANRGRSKLLLEFDTASLANAYHGHMELTAFNTGSTQRGGPRRGLATFTPLAALDYAQWRRLRGRLDRVREVTVLDVAVQVEPHLTNRTVVVGGAHPARLN
jgi:hypothetical protein